MAVIADLVKGHELFQVSENQSVLDAVRAMVARNIGAVPVVRNADLVGLFSERDLMKRVVAEGRDAATLKISDVMTTDVTTVAPNESIEHCMVLMKQHGFRHLPICDGRRLVGMLSLRDLLLYEVAEKDVEVQMFRAYINSSS